MRNLSGAVFGALWGIAGLWSTASLHAQEYPERAVRVIVSSAPGGGVDRVARMVAEKLQDRWNRPFPVENRAGASGNIGAEIAARAVGRLLKNPASAMRAERLLNDSELLGIPHRIVIGDRALKEGNVEYAERRAGESQSVPVGEVVEKVLAAINAK